MVTAARTIICRLNAWRWRRARPPKAVVAEPPAFPTAAFNAALNKMVEIAVDAGRREERARIAAIMSLPKAERFLGMAWEMALSGVVSPEQADKAFAAAEFDALARAASDRTTTPETDGRLLLH
jgi:hypothetical protein